MAAGIEKRAAVLDLFFSVSHVQPVAESPGTIP
jgi:hypothetical protein